MLGLQIMKNEPWMNRKDVKNWRLQRQIIIRKTIDFIRELTFKLQNKRIEKYEQRVKEKGYKVGDLVWVYCPEAPLNRNNKLYHKW